MNGHKSSHKEIKNEVNLNGKMIAKVSQTIDSLKNKEEEPKTAVKTEVEIPAKGVHVIKSDENTNVQHNKEESGVDSKRSKTSNDDEKYGPEDMAEYIFWTGDEKGVALTIQEFLRVGLMSREEAIGFLQAIKYQLELMQLHYQQLQKISNKGKASVKRIFKKVDNFSEDPKRNLYYDGEGKLWPLDLSTIKSGSPEIVLADATVKQNSYGDQMNTAKGHSSGHEYFEQRNKSYSKLPSVTKTFEGGSDDDYDEIMERLRVTGSLRKEYSLEEVIFELAKIMFSESLTKGNREAQKAMQKFSDFLQNQVQHNQLSRNLQRKVLDILSSALMEALSDHPKLLNRSVTDQIILDQNSPASEALKQLLMLGSKQLTSQSNPKEDSSEKTLLLGGKKLYKGVK